MRGPFRATYMKHSENRGILKEVRYERHMTKPWAGLQVFKSHSRIWYSENVTPPIQATTFCTQNEHGLAVHTGKQMRSDEISRQVRQKDDARGNLDWTYQVATKFFSCLQARDKNPFLWSSWQWSERSFWLIFNSVLWSSTKMEGVERRRGTENTNKFQAPCCPSGISVGCVAPCHCLSVIQCHFVHIFFCFRQQLRSQGVCLLCWCKMGTRSHVKDVQAPCRDYRVAIRYGLGRTIETLFV